MKPTFKFLAFISVLCATSIASPSAFAQGKGRVEVSLLGLFPMGDPTYQKYDDYYLVRGRIFDNAFVQSVYEDGGVAVYQTDKQYDLFEADIATNCSSIHDQIRFYVLGDGDVIYRSPRLTNADKPVHISVPIKKYRGVSLVTEAYFRGGLPKAVWGDAQLVLLPGSQVKPPITSRPTPGLPAPATGPSIMPSDTTITLNSQSDGPYEVAINGKAVKFGYVGPTLKDGTLLVPMRPLFEALGATVSFDDSTNTILATRQGREIRMQLGSTKAYVNGRLSPLDVPAQSMLGTTLVPLRFISEAFGAKLKFPELDSSNSDSNPLAY